MSVDLTRALKKPSSSHEMLCPAEASGLNCISHEELPKTPPIQSPIESRINDASIEVFLYAEQISSPASRMDIEYLPPLEQGEIGSEKGDSLSALPIVAETASTEKGKDRKIIASHIEKLLKTGRYFHSNGRIHFPSLARAANVNRANLRRAFFKSVKFCAYSDYLKGIHNFEVSQNVSRKKPPSITIKI